MMANRMEQKFGNSMETGRVLGCIVLRHRQVPIVPASLHDYGMGYFKKPSNDSG